MKVDTSKFEWIQTNSSELTKHRLKHEDEPWVQLNLGAIQMICDTSPPLPFMWYATYFIRFLNTLDFDMNDKQNCVFEPDLTLKHDFFNFQKH